MAPHHRRPRPQAVFLDRDGTLIEHRPYLSDPKQVVLLPGVREAFALAAAASIRLFLFTNQSGVGRGFFTLDDVEAVNRRMIELLDLGAMPFERICIAPETPDQPCRYRKPSPTFIHEMVAEHGLDRGATWMLGDSPVDWEAGINAGIRTAAIAPNSRDSKAIERRQSLGIPAYEGILAWLRDQLDS